MRWRDDRRMIRPPQSVEDRPTLRVLSSPALENVLRHDLLPAFDAQWHCRSHLETGLSRQIRGELALARAPADVVVAASQMLREVPADTVASPPHDVARAYVGLAVLGEAAPCDTAEQLRDMLLGARSVAYSQGMSGTHLLEVASTLGIREALVTRGTLIPRGSTGAALWDGRCDVAVQQVSELLLTCSPEMIVPFPSALQQISTFAAVALSASQHSELSAELVRYLTSAEAVCAILASGLIVPAAGRHSHA